MQDTHTLLGKAIRKLLRVLGHATRGKRKGLSAQAQQLLATYLDQDRKAKIDWADPAQRASQLKVLVQDAEATLAVAATGSEDEEVRATGWLLAKVLGDDVFIDEHGDLCWQLSSEIRSGSRVSG